MRIKRLLSRLEFLTELPERLQVNNNNIITSIL